MSDESYYMASLLFLIAFIHKISIFYLRSEKILFSQNHYSIDADE